MHNYRKYFVGLETLTPVINGTHRRYINLDNAASTPPFLVVQEAINNFLPYYSSVHRGTGFKSQISTHAYERARLKVMQFFNADPADHVCIFGKNTTEAINKLAHRFPFNKRRNVVLTSGMEHHSNDLPWRNVTKTIHIQLTSDGRLDENDFDEQLEKYKDHVALVAITGASNVTGFITPIHRLAEKTHAVGAQILVDCAQLAPHRQVNVLELDNPAHLDYISISAHKMYAPFGTGALIGRRDTFENGDPDMRGGGTVEIVTFDNVIWTDPPERDEAGSPNTIGAVALAASIDQLSKIGMRAVAQHEADLTRYALQELRKVPNIKFFGDTDPDKADDRLGVISMELDHLSHFKVAAILGYEFSIGVRSGCFCAHPYILHLLQLTPDEAKSARQKIIAGDKSDMPGLIRASFGLYNTTDDIDELVDALIHIAHGEYVGNYIQNSASGEFSPQGWAPDYSRFFSYI